MGRFSGLRNTEGKEIFCQISNTGYFCYTISYRDSQTRSGQGVFSNFFQILKGRVRNSSVFLYNFSKSYPKPMETRNPIGGQNLKGGITGCTPLAISNLLLKLGSPNSPGKIKEIFINSKLLSRIHIFNVGNTNSE